MQSFGVNGNFGEDEEVVMLGCAGFGGVAVQIAGTLSGTVVFEGTVDGVNYSAVIMTPIGTTVGVTSTTTAGLWRGCCTGLLAFRARCSEYSSGNANVAIRVSESSPSLINITGP